MKKIISFTLALITLLLSLMSCTPDPNTTSTINPNTEETPNITIAKTGMLLYDNTFFYKTQPIPDGNLDDVTIKYQNIENIQPEGILLYADSLGENEDPFRGYGNAFMLIDEKATKENGGIPVLIIAYGVMSEEGSYIYKIVSFNQSTNKLNVIADNIGNGFTSFCLIDDTIFYQYNTGDKEGYVFFSVNKNGGEPEITSFSSQNQVVIIGCYGETIYMFENGTTKIISCDMNFENSKNILESCNLKCKPFIEGEILYYGNDNSEITVGENKIEGCNIYKIDLTSPDSAPELFMENVISASNYDSKLFYSLKDDVSIVSFGTFTYATCHTVKMYDFITEEKSTILDKSMDTSVSISVLDCNDRFIWYSIDNKRYFMSLKTLELVEFPGFYN